MRRGMAVVVAVFYAKMEGFMFPLRLGGRIIGRVAAELDPSESLACAKGSLTEAAEKALGHKVVIKRFMATVWGRTGFLQPEMEFAPLVECTSVMTSRIVVLDLGIPALQTSDSLQYKSQSPMRRSCSSNSIVSACDHFEFYKESY
ncbi:hypothetical protein WJX77_009511 [Trebouxia sp. C0004]